MKKYIILIVFSLLLQNCCVSDDNTNPNNDFIYVKTGGNGDGTMDNPLGSIQAAIDMVVNNNLEKDILVCEGVYQQSSTLQIKNSVCLYGGYDANWDRDIDNNNARARHAACWRRGRRTSNGDSTPSKDESLTKRPKVSAQHGSKSRSCDGAVGQRARGRPRHAAGLLPICRELLPIKVVRRK